MSDEALKAKLIVPDTGPLVLIIEYGGMAAYGARTTFEIADPKRENLFASQSVSPATLLSAEAADKRRAVRVIVQLPRPNAAVRRLIPPKSGKP